MRDELENTQAVDTKDLCDGYMRKPHRIDECYDGVNLTKVGELHLCPDCISQWAYDRNAFEEQWEDDND